MYKYFSLVIIAGLFFLQTNAQQRNSERRESRPERSFSPHVNREQRMQSPQQRQQNNSWGNNQPGNRERRMQTQPQRQQVPRDYGQSDNRSRRDGNRQEQRIDQRQNQRQPQANNNESSRRNNANNNNRFGNNRNYARASHYDNYRFGPGYRRPVYNSRNPGWRYSYLPRRNAVITNFSFPYQTINYGGYGYRYCDGVYYRPYNNVFRVVAPPFGIFINVLPFGYNRIFVNDYPYYYYNGTYYDDYENSYRVVAPPVGAVVESIPEGYETIVIDGETYYDVDGVQYKPVVQDNGEIWYEVIKVDGESN